jgi:hypothetical protein
VSSGAAAAGGATCVVRCCSSRRSYVCRQVLQQPEELARGGQWERPCGIGHALMSAASPYNSSSGVRCSVLAEGEVSGCCPLHASLGSRALTRQVQLSAPTRESRLS